MSAWRFHRNGEASETPSSLDSQTTLSTLRARFDTFLFELDLGAVGTDRRENASLPM
jgi:hypothetical protein